MEIRGSEIVRQLVREKWAASFVIPSFTPDGWWENDVFEVTKARYWHEYEVKTSRSDFLADSRKRKVESWSVVERRLVPNEGPTKHEMLAGRSERGPSRFTFVVPDGMLGVHEVPEWAGLIVARKSNNGRWLSLITAKPAPRLHKLAFDLKGVWPTCYYRFHRAVAKFEDSYQAEGSGI